VKQYIFLANFVPISASASKYLFMHTFQGYQGFGPQMHGSNTRKMQAIKKKHTVVGRPNHPRIKKSYS